MNNKGARLLKNFSYTLISNLVTLLTSILIVLIIPKVVGVEIYGYWQLYLFYSTYVGFMHFGWVDGIYLRYGGQRYKDLNQQLFFSQFYMFFGSQLFISITIILFSFIIVEDADRFFIFCMTALCLIIMNLRNFPILILQATYRIKEYAFIMILGKLLSLIIMILFLLVGLNDYKFLIIADLMGKFISLLYALKTCKEFIRLRVTKFYFSFKEMLANINAGIKLMFSNIASLLLIGIVRFGIERTWDVITFGKVSLTLSISNFLMIFINAMGIVIFPLLKRIRVENLSIVYIDIRNLLMLTLLTLLMIFYPLEVGLRWWLPEYEDSIRYMALLFPMFIFEGKMALLINTYFKALRKESLMLNINLLAVFISLVLTIMTTLYLENLELTILSLVIVLAFRSIISEILLSKVLNIKVFKDIVLELILATIFIYVNWNLPHAQALTIYLIFLILYIVLKSRTIATSFKNLKQFLVK